MKKFRFRLQPLLLVREVEERRFRDSFLQRHREHVAATERTERAHAEREEVLEEIRQARTEPVAAWSCAQRDSGLALVEHRLVESRKELAELRGVLETARREWVEARRRLEVVKRLREHAKRAHAAENARREQEMLDELAVLRHDTRSEVA